MERVSGRLLRPRALLAPLGRGEGTFSKEERGEFGANDGTKTVWTGPAAAHPSASPGPSGGGVQSVAAGAGGSLLCLGLLLVAGASGGSFGLWGTRAGEGGGLGWSPASAESQAGPGGLQ